MIKENSGKIYRFNLEHDLGFGFAEVYDFTDLSMFDGRIVYVYNRLDKDEKASYELSEIRNTGIALGPIRLHKFPNIRGLHSWRFLFQTNNLLITELPETKELIGLEWTDDNWNNFNKWYNSNYEKKEHPTFIDYEKIRHLETRIINPPLAVVKKFTMKNVLDNKKKFSDYYDLSERGNKNLFVQMINTYYPLEKTKELLKLLPSLKK